MHPTRRPLLVLTLLFATCCAASTPFASAQTFSSLASFDGTDGNQPWVSLIQASDGNLYGTTNAGGAYGFGNIFRISPAGGTPVSIYSFCKNFVEQGYCADGEAVDEFGVLQATDGDLYGTTAGGGSDSVGAGGSGTFYKVTLSGHLTTEYDFCSLANCADGRSPGPIVQANNGNFYGTTVEGGAYGYGTVFEITPEGVLTTLHSFCATVNAQGDCSDGQSPYSGVLQGTDGNFYGTATETVFKITSTGTFTVLYTFCSLPNCADGDSPIGALVQGFDGNFYGTTTGGGTNLPAGGTAFQITPSGTLTTLYSFCSQYLSEGLCTDGEGPRGLVQGTDGNFYGTTYAGGANCSPGGCGTVFQIIPEPQSGCPTGYNTGNGWCQTVLHSFDGADGYELFGGLVQATNGTFYGTTLLGGSIPGTNDGTIFSISTGLGEFVQVNPSADDVGKKVTIVGNGLTGSTAVTFNGTLATFTVSKSTEITATVPSGATTGTLAVTTPSGTLSSNVAFRVLPQLKSFTPKKGPVGADVVITGVSLTQTSSVTFGGIAATSFTVNSDTQVSATVPSGAETGTIAITTLGGTVTSKSTFTVTE